MTWSAATNENLFDMIVTRIVAFVLFCSGCLILPATSIIFWLTLRHKQIRIKPINWSIVNFALVDVVFGVGAAMQSVALVMENDSLCEISAALMNALMTANLFSLAAIAAQFDGMNRLEEKLLLRLSSGDETGVAPKPPFTVGSAMLINTGIWVYVFIASLPLLVSPNYGSVVVGVCGVVAYIPGFLYSFHLAFAASAIVTCSTIIILYCNRLQRTAILAASRRGSTISASSDRQADQATDRPPIGSPTANDAQNALQLVRVSFLSLIGSRGGWFVAEVLSRNAHDAVPLYAVRLLFMLTPIASLINPWMVLLLVEQYRQGMRGEAITDADRNIKLLQEPDALKRRPRIDPNRLHPDSFPKDWRVQASSQPVSRQLLGPPRPLDINRKSFSQTELLPPRHYFRPISAES